MLLRERQTIDKNSPPVRLLSPLAPRRLFRAVRLDRPRRAGAGRDTVWTAERPCTDARPPVTLTGPTPSGLRFEIMISVDDGYLFTVKQRVANASPSRRGAPYRPRQPRHQSPDPDSWTIHVGPFGVLDGTADYGINWKTLDEGSKALSSTRAAGSASPTNIG